MLKRVLAATLAGQYFEPISALPAAVFSVWHNISGGLLALLYRSRPTEDTQKPVPALKG